MPPAAAAPRRRHARIATLAAMVVVVVGCGATRPSVEGGLERPGTTVAGEAPGTVRDAEPGFRDEPVMLFPPPVDPVAGIRRAGLPVLPTEGNLVHHHAHLDVFVENTPVIVPANIGIVGRELTPLHTHDETGVLHIESHTRDRFTLGQFFNEWDVHLDERCIGTFCADDQSTLRAFVDGEEIDGDPAEIELADRQEIALWYGPRAVAPDVPSSYDWN